MNNFTGHFINAKKIVVFLFFFFTYTVYGQDIKDTNVNIEKQKSVHKSKAKIGQEFFGVASFYGNKFNGKKTASGEIFSQEKYTAACNVLPLGTWIKVTNLKNHKSVIVKTNDRLHPKMNRIVDLSKTAAQKIGFLNGIIKVKIEVVQKPTQIHNRSHK